MELGDLEDGRSEESRRAKMDMFGKRISCRAPFLAWPREAA